MGWYLLCERMNQNDLDPPLPKTLCSCRKCFQGYPTCTPVPPEHPQVLSKCCFMSASDSAPVRFLDEIPYCFPSSMVAFQVATGGLPRSQHTRAASFHQSQCGCFQSPGDCSKHPGPNLWPGPVERPIQVLILISGISFHESDLTGAFFSIVLIDADYIDPEQEALFGDVLSLRPFKARNNLFVIGSA